MSSQGPHNEIDKSALWTGILVIFMFSVSIFVVLVAPYLTENTWVTPVCEYQKQMYEVADPNVYISTASSEAKTVHTIYHLHAESSPLAFVESAYTHILAPEELQGYLTQTHDTQLKLTHRLLLLKEPQDRPGFMAKTQADQWIHENIERWKSENRDWKERGLAPPRFEVYELYDPQLSSTFTLADSDGITENWVDPQEYKWVEPFDGEEKGSLYIKNPRQYRLSSYYLPDGTVAWQFDAKGKAVESLDDLREVNMGFLSREKLISIGEDIYAAEGCFNCHTDQTRTLIQDVVLNGLDHPAPPSSPGEYIYQRVTFPGTKRNGPDISRVGVKRMSRDWHMAHFWSPKTASPGSIMPSFRHFFDFAPSGTEPNHVGIPNYRFEAVYQYLMTKGTRLENPTKSWWRGLDPRTQEIIEGKWKKGKKE